MADLTSYPQHGGQLRQIAERFSIPESELVDFSANINPDGPPLSVLSTLRASLDDLSTLTAYPDLQLTDLKRSIAMYAGAKAENILVANGFVPLLEATLRTMRVQSCLLPVPAFVEYRRSLERINIEIFSHPLTHGSMFVYDPKFLFSGHHESILLANPQNPTGVLHDAPSMCDLVAKALERNMYVLLDEAFIDYMPEHSLSAMTDRFSNLVVFRSVTKFHGIPGLRVAYAVTNPDLAGRIAENLSPWPITTLASYAVIAALSDEPYAIRSRSENHARRVALQAGLEACGLITYPAAANFILFRLPSSINPDLFWTMMILEHHIVLRSCSNYEALGTGHFRTAVRTQEENCRLTHAVTKTLAQLQSA